LEGLFVLMGALTLPMQMRLLRFFCT